MGIATLKMRRTAIAGLALAFATAAAQAQSSSEIGDKAAAGSPAEAAITAAAGDPAKAGGIATALRAIMDSAGPVANQAEGVDEDRAALAQFYRDRDAAPLWMAETGPTANARALATALADAASYGLDPRALAIPALDGVSGDAALARADYDLSLAALTYARQARGGRIPRPSEQLNSNLDRKPQLIEPATVMQRLATAEDAGQALAATNPVHPQFERLRSAWLAATDGKGGGKLSAKAKQIRANMEMWRWMWDDLGEMYVFNNIPEFMQRVYKGGEVVRTERIVVGEVSKQSSVFSRPLKAVVLRPRWRVPESIMVHELWPSLLKGGGLMRRHGLEITTKDGEPRDWRSIDWSKDDIRRYHVWQEAGPKSAVGFVKFSFPSQHTIFMHDTPDKWMFNAKRRTLSHGCLRVRNPFDLAAMVLEYDKGMSRAEVQKLIKSGPPDNDIEMSKPIPVHLAYFTAWVDDDGKLNTFSDIYGHEKRVTQALDGEWNKINKGRNHLAPPKPRFDRSAVASGDTPSRTERTAKKQKSTGNIISDALGINF